MNENPKLLRALIENSADALHVLDPATGRFLDVNESACQALGYTRDELLALSMFDVMADLDRVRFEEEMALIKKTGHFTVEVQHRRKDGTLYPVEVSLTPATIDREYLLAVVRNITDHKRAEERIADALNFNLTILRASPMGIVVFNASGSCVSANEAAAAIIGCTRRQVLQQNFRQLESWKSGGLLETAEAALATQAQRTLEACLTSSFGKQIWLNCRFVPFYHNAAPHLMLILMDVTERKRAEAAVRESQALYLSLFNQMPAGLFRKDCEGRFVVVNPVFCQLKALSEEEILGKTPKELDDYERAKEAAGLLKHPPRQRMLAKQGADHHRRIMRTGETIEVEEVYPQPDGTVEYFNAVKTPVFDAEGKVIGSQGMQFDITERKRAEIQLRRLSAAVEHSPASIVITDRDGNIEYVNPKFTAVSGYSAEEVVGKNPRFLKSGKTPAEEYRRMWQTILAGKEWQGEFQNRKKNGELYWESASISAIFDDSGEIAHFVAVKEDITEVNLAREKLRQRESFLSAIAENQPGLLWLKDAEGRFLTVNRFFATALGRDDPAQLHGLTDFDINPKELAEKYRADDQRVMATGQPMVVEEQIDIGGKGVWHETFKSPVRDDQGRVIGTTGFALDISARKQAEQQLKEAFNFNRTIILDAPVGITVFKGSGQCVLANITAARVLKATVPQLLAQDFRQIASWRASGMLEIAEEVLATREPQRCEPHFVSTFGAEVWLQSHFSHFIQNGESHLIHIFSDVTERKKLEAQLLRAQRMESIGTLAGGIAHDLNNVLAPLLISIHLLKEKITDDEGRELLAMLETNVNRGSDLVKQVLAFGRGIRGERVQVQLKHIARNMKQIVQETFPKTVRLQMDVAHDLWMISGDATQIEQVLLNLCVNARDAMPDGGTLRLDMENKVLDAAYAAANLEARPGRYVVVTVADTGQGIPREILDRIFEPFFTTKEQGKGTGLGLSTSLAIVKSHGGFIHCYSELARGSTFKVYLPADNAANAEPALAAKPRLPRGHNELVLIVDDEEPIRNIARQILERFGYRALPAANGAEAVALYMARGPEIAVVLTDMAMPVMDGPTTIAALKDINPGVKIIGSSGLDSGVKSDGDIRHFIRKPYTAEVLLNELHDVLRENSGK